MKLDFAGNRLLRILAWHLPLIWVAVNMVLGPLVYIIGERLGCFKSISAAFSIYLVTLIIAIMLLTISNKWFFQNIVKILVYWIVVPFLLLLLTGGSPHQVAVAYQRACERVDSQMLHLRSSKPGDK